MKKLVLLLMVSVFVFLAACSGSQLTTTPEMSKSEPEATATDIAQSTATSEPKQSSPLLAGSDEPTECNVVGLLPPLDPTQQALFPPVTEGEWIKGPSNAAVTIVEYSDFQ